MNKPEYIIIHHSATTRGDAKTFRETHKSWGWRDIGYHYVIGNGTYSSDGEIEAGRMETETGAHCAANGMNNKSIGICLVGNFEQEIPTSAQIKSLEKLVHGIMTRYKIPVEKILGHKEVQNAKTLCPGKNFNMQEFRSRLADEKETPILGKPQVSLEQAQAWAKARNATNDFIAIAKLYWEMAPILNVRPEVAYAQSAKETAFGWFGGMVTRNFNNWCGLKTTKGGSNSDPKAHACFPDDQTGVLAHLQHLALYAGQTVIGEIVDPRHFSNLEGTAKTVEALGGRWAPNKDYGKSIVKDYLISLLKTKIVKVTEPKSKLETIILEKYERVIKERDEYKEKLERIKEILGE